MDTLRQTPRIHKLSPELIGKIAAGEVVERPASVVKELLENALDAGARSIEVRLEQGGLKLIEVADDGCGLTPEEMPLALTEHATSKVRDYDDLFNLHTLGFRGEALGAIRRVSHLSLISAPAPGQAHELNPSGEIVPTARDQGTTVRVADLFHNTPARKKFMKEASKELMAATEIVVGYALMRPEVGFLLTDGSRTVVRTLAQEDLGTRVMELFGREAWQGLVPVETEEGDVRLWGFLSRPSATRSDARKLFFLVNGRLVQDRWLLSSLMSRYRGMIPPRKYPFGVVQISVPPHLVDVNVHPTKREVRFVANGPVYMVLSRAVDKATRVVGAFMEILPPSGPDGGELDFAPSLPAPGGPAFSEPGTRFNPAPTHWARSAAPRSFLPERPFGLNPTGSQAGQNGQNFTVAIAQGHATLSGNLRFLAQLYHTYLLFTIDGAPYLADQHVAHERVLYEQFSKALKQRHQLPSQGLLVPLPLPLSPPEVVQVQANREALLRYGLDLEPFGEGAVLVRGLPVGRRQSNASLSELLSDVLNTLEQNTDLSARDQAMVARLSCRSAVMAGDELDPTGAAELIRNLLACDNPDTCPHGRPIISRLSEDELAPRFHRPKKGRCGVRPTEETKGD